MFQSYMFRKDSSYYSIFGKRHIYKKKLEASLASKETTNLFHRGPLDRGTSATYSAFFNLLEIYLKINEKKGSNELSLVFKQKNQRR